jgi:hypothetical protein
MTTMTMAMMVTMTMMVISPGPLTIPWPAWSIMGPPKATSEALQGASQRPLRGPSQRPLERPPLRGPLRALSRPPLWALPYPCSGPFWGHLPCLTALTWALTGPARKGHPHRASSQIPTRIGQGEARPRPLLPHLPHGLTRAVPTRLSGPYSRVPEKTVGR